MLYIDEDARGNEEFLEHDEKEEGNVAMFTSEDEEDSLLLVDEVCHINRNLETILAKKSFSHICGYFHGHKERIKEMHNALNVVADHIDAFNWIFINTACTLRSLVLLRQYSACCREYSAPVIIYKRKALHVLSLGGRREIYWIGSGISPTTGFAFSSTHLVPHHG